MHRCSRVGLSGIDTVVLIFTYYVVYRYVGSNILRAIKKTSLALSFWISGPSIMLLKCDPHFRPSFHAMILAIIYNRIWWIELPKKVNIVLYVTEKILGTARPSKTKDTFSWWYVSFNISSI